MEGADVQGRTDSAQYGMIVLTLVGVVLVRNNARSMSESEE